MTINEFYEKVEGNYQETLGRLLKEDRIVKYLSKFLENTDYNTFLEALENSDYELAFRSVHNLKGMALNLGLGKLSVISSDVCEDLRGGVLNIDISDKLSDLSKIYSDTVEIIKEFIC